MTDEALELLITLDDPNYAPEEDTFSHLQAHNLGYWLGRQYPTRTRPGESFAALSDQDTRVAGGLQE
jgi:hypothetical protein